jgi:phosphatidylethanolamine/phosphatidyl-N-methylethanolamine N-methyltransferase
MGVIDTNWWNRLRYSLYSPLYDPIVRLLGRGRKRSVEMLKIRPGERVLIVGCGTGLDFELLPPGIHLAAGDITPAMVNRARRRAKEQGLEADIRVMDAHSLDLPDDSFDVVLLHLILAVVPDPYAAISEAARVLKPGGRVGIFDKFIAGGHPPSIRRRIVNSVARIVATDINRSVEPLLDYAGLTRVHDEEAFGRGLFRVVLARKLS